MKNVIIGTAGHIDHGKSALVEALTGTHPDRLEEEKRRGITIDLGFAFLESGGVRLGFVDVPGHERFVRNMLAGAAGIDLVLLVIAADESIKPQTREHFEICRLLGISRGIIALTKADLVDQETLELVRLEVEEFVRGSFLDGAPILPVSARTGAGVEALRSGLLAAANATTGRDDSRHSRLPVDRAFAVKGFGTVVTGTLVSGQVKAGDELELFPAGRPVRVRGVQSAGHGVEQACAGQRTALNLAGVELADVRRGMVLASPGRFQPTRQIDARIQLLGTARPLKNRALVHFHEGTAETVAEVVTLEGAAIAPGESGLAQLRLREPTLVLAGDRFILRQFSPVTTIGGGLVLDGLAPRHRANDAAALALLRTLEAGRRDDSLAALAAAEPRGLGLWEVVARMAWGEDEIRASAEALERAGRLKIVSREPWILCSAENFAACTARMLAALDAFHRTNPLVAGMPKEELRARAARHLRAEVFPAALAELAARGEAEVQADTVRRAGRKIVLTAEEQRARELLVGAFETASLTAPRLEELLSRLPVDPQRARKLLQLLLREGILVKVSEELVFHRAAIVRLRELLADYKKRRGERISVANFKELTGISRKYAIPLLEFLDREQATRRAGDERVIL